MNRRQRQLHLAVWLILGPLLVIGVSLALSERPSAPSETSPAETAP